MTELLRFLVPILLILSAAAVQGAPVGVHGSRQQVVLEPTPELPRRWPLPAGWMAVPPRQEQGRLVEYLSGPTPAMWGRVYTWPLPRTQATAGDARRLSLRELGPGYRLAGSRTRRGVMEFTCLGWSQSKEPQDNRGKPDVAVFGRASRVGDRLVAGYLEVRLEGANRELEKEVRAILAGLEFSDHKPRDVIAGWGQTVRGGKGRGRSRGYSF